MLKETKIPQSAEYKSWIKDLKQKLRKSQVKAVIKVNNFRKAYGAFVAVDDISFGVQRGEIFGLLGPNGAGKTTFYNLFLAPKGIKLVNADIIAKAINPENPEKFSYAAANVAEQIREKLLQQGVSFCFETVFSHVSKIDFVANAKAQGYEIILVYIHLDTSELNEARVHQRITEGGHNVPGERRRGLPRHSRPRPPRGDSRRRLVGSRAVGGP